MQSCGSKRFLRQGENAEKAFDLGWKHGTDEFWEIYNKPFLLDAFKRGDNIRLISDPYNFRYGTYARELKILEEVAIKQYNYIYDTITKTYGIR